MEETNLDTIYVTVWASPYLPLHMGKTENATKMQEDHFGIQLQVLFALINLMMNIQDGHFVDIHCFLLCFSHQ